MAVAGPVGAVRDDHVMDTRMSSPSLTPTKADSSADETGSGTDYKPDLSAEVAMLSTKLVNAINYQTNLDDSLQHTRLELEQAQQENAQLRTEKDELDGMVSSGVLVKKDEMDQAIAQLRAELAAEKTAREAAEKAKKQTEGELENLTSALFEEANTMVAAARRDKEAMDKKNSQLKSQLNDTELLLASQQEQLKDLKNTMERIRDASPSGRGEGSVPSTPIIPNSAAFEALMETSDAPPAGELTPEPSMHFPYLVTAVIRDDIPAHTEFQELLLLARRLGAHSRQSSNSANPTNSSQANHHSNTSTPNLPGTFAFSSTSSSPSSTVAPTSSLPPLKDSKFYKRILIEDLDPTLRLDLAPGLSFLSRRTALSALINGSLSVEPFPQNKTNKHYHACSLCGESRRTEAHVRRWRFRTSEEDGVIKPLCNYCVGRVRASCDFLAFLRAVREGLWGENKGAWEESVRLREAMWWSRIGGGVVPNGAIPKIDAADKEEVNSTTGVKSGRQSLDSSAGKRDHGLAADAPNGETASVAARSAPQAETQKPLPQPPATPLHSPEQHPTVADQPPISLARPDVPTAEIESATAAEVVPGTVVGPTHQPSSQLEADEIDDSVEANAMGQPPSDSTLSTPFEEAHQELTSSGADMLSTFTSANTEPAEETGPAHSVTETTAILPPTTTEEPVPSPPVTTEQQAPTPPAEAETFEPPAAPKPQRSPSPSQSSSTPKPEQRPPHERAKPSGGVLARVRAMEARAASQQK